ncbi:hypothetical protein [Dehalobacterium formicoaceticum]|uniref:hypothetical protein n=1 Tax=Dehalobacterium formicoaceticum TaxID=51515 RepID=UPI000B7E6ED6|nr:hypothetical protein [Dehalobacterium formicoaceticum]
MPWTRIRVRDQYLSSFANDSIIQFPLFRHPNYFPDIPQSENYQTLFLNNKLYGIKRVDSSTYSTITITCYNFTNYDILWQKTKTVRLGALYYYSTALTNEGDILIYCEDPSNNIYIQRLSGIDGTVLWTAGNLGSLHNYTYDSVSNAIFFNMYDSNDPDPLGPYFRIRMDAVTGQIDYKIPYDYNYEGDSVQPLISEGECIVTPWGRCIRFGHRYEPGNEVAFLSGVDINSGQLLWSRQVRQYSKILGLDASNQHVYFLSPPSVLSTIDLYGNTINETDGQIYAFDNLGELVWPAPSIIPTTSVNMSVVCWAADEEYIYTSWSTGTPNILVKTRKSDGATVQRFEDTETLVVRDMVLFVSAGVKYLAVLRNHRLYSTPIRIDILDVNDLSIVVQTLGVNSPSPGYGAYLLAEGDALYAQVSSRLTKYSKINPAVSYYLELLNAFSVTPNDTQYSLEYNEVQLGSKLRFQFKDDVDIESITKETLKIQHRYTTEQAPYVWREGEGTLLELISAEDDKAQSIDLSALGFNLMFNNIIRSTLYVGTNGIMGFDDTVSYDYGSALPHASHETLICPFAGDFEGVPDVTRITYCVKATSPRELVITWENTFFYGKNDTIEKGLTFQCVFVEYTNTIYFNYKDVLVGDATKDYGNGRTIGFQNANNPESIGLFVRGLDNPSVHNERAIKLNSNITYHNVENFLAITVLPTSDPKIVDIVIPELKSKSVYTVTLTQGIFSPVMGYLNKEYRYTVFSDVSLGSSAITPFECSPPQLLEPFQATSAKCPIVFSCPTPAGVDPQWLLHFAVRAYADEAGTQLISEVLSTAAPWEFLISVDNATWQPFPGAGVPPEMYGCRIKVMADLGPRTGVWIKLSVGAEES